MNSFCKQIYTFILCITVATVPMFGMESEVRYGVVVEPEGEMIIIEQTPVVSDNNRCLQIASVAFVTAAVLYVIAVRMNKLPSPAALVGLLSGYVAHTALQPDKPDNDPVFVPVDPKTAQHLSETTNRVKKAVQQEVKEAVKPVIKSVEQKIEEVKANPTNNGERVVSASQPYAAFSFITDTLKGFGSTAQEQLGKVRSKTQEMRSTAQGNYSSHERNEEELENIKYPDQD